ncbi:MAG: hypothetical protein R3D28_18965 [Geminicoccaceae bacterium]
MTGALFAALAGALSFVVEATGPWQVAYFYATLFVLLTLGEQGSIQGRMTYLVNHASDHDRPAMVATNSTTGWIVGIGVAALLAMAGQFQDIRLPLVILIGTNIAAALYVSLMLDADTDQGLRRAIRPAAAAAAASITGQNSLSMADGSGRLHEPRSFIPAPRRRPATRT